uniref:Glycosyltransferase n=1 Tax=Litchi chinensis TaxID=151069 RepID=W8FS36_LITCN|nr:UDP-glycosyltransferase 2 [Litchi chinensis]
MSEGRENSQKHIAVFAFPFATHATPLLSLVRKLSQSAPDVKFCFFNTAQSNESLFSKDDDFERVKPCTVDSGLPEGYTFGGNPHEPVDYFLKATPGNYKKAVADTGLPFEGLVTDAFFWFSKEMADEMRVPWIPYFTAGPRPLLIHVDIDDIRTRLGINGPEDQTLEFLPGCSAIRAMDLPDGVVSGFLDSPFSRMLHKMGQMLPFASAVAINSFEEIDPIVVQTLKSRLPNLLNIGPFILRSPPPFSSDIHGCIDWLNQRPKASVAYICFGSVITPPPQELEALAEALEACQFPFLWSFRGKAEEMLPKGFLERTNDKGLIVPWAPQLKVLGHPSIGVFVTHCGWNSVTESIIGGVPMICRPFFAEQKLNQRTVEAVWGFGLAIEGGKFTKDGTMKALKVILSSEEGKLMREKVGVFKELAFKAVDSDGSSIKNFNFLVDFVTRR